MSLWIKSGSRVKTVSRPSSQTVKTVHWQLWRQLSLLNQILIILTDSWHWWTAQCHSTRSPDSRQQSHETHDSHHWHTRQQEQQLQVYNCQSVSDTVSEVNRLNTVTLRKHNVSTGATGHWQPLALTQQSRHSLSESFCLRQSEFWWVLGSLKPFSLLLIYYYF